VECNRLQASSANGKFAKDDAIGISENPHPIPRVAVENEKVIQTYVKSCATITNTLLSLLSEKLNLKDPDLPSLHKFDRPAGNQMRIIKSSASVTRTVEQVAGAHTDFGSLTVLFNNIGGLQVLLSQEEGWKWVPPRKDCAIINLGDAMVSFTEGFFKSATHRVVQPPPNQRAFDRYSVVYFERPNDDVKLRPLTRDAGPLDQYPTAKEWIERRVLGGKVVHYAGEKNYYARRGTEAAGAN
jgi:isopenicillin N synthase-like dioxygenase